LTIFKEDDLQVVFLFASVYYIFMAHEGVQTTVSSVVCILWKAESFYTTWWWELGGIHKPV